MTKEYVEKVKYIWQNLVPPRGQADTVQGELLRAIEKLADEAQRNGNMNWDKGHEILVDYLVKTIDEAKILDDKKSEQFHNDMNRILKYNQPYIENDLYDRVVEIVVDYFVKFPEPIKHNYNSNLHR